MNLAGLNLPERLRPLAAQRCIAIDLGSSHIKVLLAEESLGQIRLLQHQLIDLTEEGLISAEEINRHLQGVIKELGSFPIALVIPQHLAISQVIDLPPAAGRDIQQLIEEETISLSGLSDSAIIYDYYRLAPFGKFHNPIWVTIGREQEIREQIGRFAATGASFCGITTTANALISAFLALGPPTQRIVLADLGATSTTMAIIDHGQGVYATSFPIGGESFTEAVANHKKCTFEEAEVLKRSQDLFSPAHSPLPEYGEVADAWLKNVEKILQEWFEDNADWSRSIEPFRILLSGGGSLQPGLIAYLQRKSVYEFQPWPETPGPAAELPMARYAIAWGALHQAFNPSVRSCSLLPIELRVVKQRQTQLLRVNLASLVMLGLIGLMLVVGSCHKLWLIFEKHRLIDRAEAALNKAQAIDILNQRREVELANLQPVLERQKNMADLMQVMQILQQVREQKDLWFVLLADAKSYFAGTTMLPVETLRSNSLGSILVTNPPAVSNGFVVELCIPDKGGEKLKPLNDLVAELKKQTLFRKVDTLPPNQRTNLVDPKLLLADRNYSVELELAESSFARRAPVPKKKLEPPAVPTAP